MNDNSREFVPTPESVDAIEPHVPTPTAPGDGLREVALAWRATHYNCCEGMFRNCDQEGCRLAVAFLALLDEHEAVEDADLGPDDCDCPFDGGCMYCRIKAAHAAATKKLEG